MKNNKVLIRKVFILPIELSGLPLEGKLDMIKKKANVVGLKNYTVKWQKNGGAVATELKK